MLVVLVVVVLVVLVVTVVLVVVVIAGTLDEDEELDEVLDSDVNDCPGTTLPMRTTALTFGLRPLIVEPVFRKQAPGGGLVFSAPP